MASTAACETIEESLKKSGKKSFAGIPEATFVDDVDAYMKDREGVESILRQLDEQHGKYKFMELNLMARKKKLKSQIPDIQKSLDMIQVLEAKQKSNEQIETHFLLSDLLYSRAIIEPTDKVCLWLGANVMLEYSLVDAKALLEKNHETAMKNLTQVHHDLDFLRDQMTTTEVNMARLYNWDVKRRQALNAK
uniref:Prefoldin subunit 3 n=1 Tax=Scapholeberis mucronata TaxID=202097 RepID=A0A4Y7NN25_9CRUS|nr:EOG090X0IRH [Scapholeberis mucronata]SVE93996.1 EOG090X0IRH [Scapholeberis mucronata]